PFPASWLSLRTTERKRTISARFRLILCWKRAFLQAHLALDNSNRVFRLAFLVQSYEPAGSLRILRQPAVVPEQARRPRAALPRGVVLFSELLWQKNVLTIPVF
ncbi:MAG: hypothetical protein WC421_06805, partial [Elusimicrobiales bacterium]